MATYDPNQIIFCLSTLSNLSSTGSGSGGKIEKDIKPEIKAVLADPTVQGLIGEWNLVWGPVVDVGPFKVGGSLAINTLYIARSADNPNHFVVAIAGTDSKSKYDWIVEDFWVGKTVTWPYLPAGWPTQPQISDGTNFGLGKLVAMQDPDTKLTARQYLQNNAANTPGSFVAVTGHSLGGALSPSYALYLNDTASEWNSAGNATLACLATAGPTPGDADFSDYYGSRLGSATTRVWNSHDVVPHAWEVDMLNQIPTLYEPLITPDIEINAFVALAKWVSRKTPYTQLLPGTAAARRAWSACRPATPSPGSCRSSATSISTTT